ncbi:proton-coupled folate transporter-like [Homalodisca vitripennis]|uniref:proton-coupled folate transporter-like n=1 Tax=Homalodisca vitripennis TaxID=197043 RepID=UPI001EEC2A56|nr:proton-coupled folate transporter-like [Homalodisca vitripennis]
MEGNIQEEAALVDEPIIKKPNGVKCKMELLMFTFFVAKTLSDTVIVNLLEHNTCLVVLDYNVSNCTDPVSPDTQGLVQEHVADVAMARTMIEAFVPSLFSLFIGPWSDTNGRRPLILLSVAGYTCSAIVWCVLSLIPQLHPLYFLLTSIPVAFAGGYVTFFLALYCYISDTTETKKRAFRMGLLEGACLGGVVVSSLVTPYLQSTSKQYGYTIVFATSAFLLLLTFLFTYFCVPESTTVIESERTKLLKFDHVKNVFSTCFRHRPNHLSVIVMCIVVDLVLFIILFDGELSILYMFTQKKFGWTLVEYTRLTSFSLLIAGASACSTWFFVAVLKWPDLPLIFAGTVCGVIKSVILAMASSGYYMYIACGFTVITVLINPLSRSQLSKLVPGDELGKIFAFSSFLEAIAPLTASPLYTFVYKATLDTLPNAIFWLSTGLCCISVTLIGLALFLQRLAPRTQGFVPVLDDASSRRSSVQE